ncbi:MAG: hypothetical protein RQ897_13140 [Thermoflexus sp.]|nr:hypothetical protein [Thermoflexus sp.]MDT7949277.1 hypothetical protein [Thermoflexus sp.]
MQDQSHPPVDWSAVAWVNGLRYLIATVLVGLFGLVLSGNLRDGLNWALMALVFYGLNLALLLALRLTYVELSQRFVNALNRAMDRSFRSLLSFEGGIIATAFRFMGFMLLFVFYMLFVILTVAPAVAHPVLYVLKRAGLLSSLPEGFPLFSRSFYVLVAAGEAPPQAEPAAPAIRAVVPGNYHAFALTESGELYAWGPMGGVLGLGDDRNYLRPTKVPGLSNIKAIFLDSGFLDHYTFALTESGEVYAWGGNEKGQLGLGDAKDRRRPTKVPGLARVKSIAVGGGLIFALALTESGEVYAWGQNERGQLGLGDREDRLTPTKVPGLTGIKAVAAGHSHSLALTESGEVYAWGRNDKGQLGLGDTEDRLTPTKVPGLAGVKAIATGAIGSDSSFALTESGEVYAWGENNDGQLGLGDRENRLMPTKVPGLAGVRAIFVSDSYGFALTESGEAYAWGENGLGNLGLGDREDRLTPTKVPGLAGVKAIAIGFSYSLALTESGEVYAWGRNDKGQLGLGNTEDRLTPTKVPGLAGIKAVAARYYQSFALTESGEVYAWGRNDKGQLGLGDTENRLTPTRMPF